MAGEIEMVSVLILSQEEMSALVPVVAEAGHVVIEAGDSGHLLQLIERVPVDMVMLPADADPVNGEELLDLTRRLALASIVVVGPENETAMVSALFRGADAYFPFPVNADMLRARVRTLLRRGSSSVERREQPGGQTTRAGAITLGFSKRLSSRRAVTTSVRR